MIFKTFNSNIDKATNKIGIFNKSFWAMQQDLKHGYGLIFSIFGGQNVANHDKQAILDLNTQLQNGVKPAKAWARTMTNCSISAQTQTKECLKANGSLTDLANGLNLTTASAKASQLALQGLSIAGNMLFMWVISEAIKTIHSCITASDRLKESA